MICYKDTTFCCNPKCTGKCGRQFTAADREAAVKWWGGDDAPVAFSDFCGREGFASPVTDVSTALRDKFCGKVE